LAKPERRLVSKIHIIFLVCCQAYSDMIAERREKVTNGVENTFGQRKNQ